MRIILIFLVFVVLQCGTAEEEEEQTLVLGYYQQSCPFVEDIVRRTVLQAIIKDPRIAAPLLRMHFHDCFVMVGKTDL